MLIKHLALAFCILILRNPLIQAEDSNPASPVNLVTPLQLKEDERTVLERYIDHATRYAEALTLEKETKRCLESPETFAWQEFLYLGALLDSYELTHNTKYLDQFKEAFTLFSGLLKKGDDEYLGWYGKPIPLRRPADAPDLQIDELQMNFRAIAILSRWVELARLETDYAQANSKTIHDYLELMEKHLFPKWDSRGFYTDLGSEGAIYRGLDYPLCNPKKPGFTISHEKCSILVEGLLGLYRVTNNSLYMKRAVQLGTRFKRCLSLKEGHYEWMSWEPAGKWDVNPAKPDAWVIGWIGPDPLGEWYTAAVSIAVNLYQYGLVFDDEDLARFISTQKTRCWNGSFTTPEYRTVAGVGSAENKYIKGRFLSCPLALYDADLSRLAFEGPHEIEILQQSTSPWQGCVAIAPYVRSKYLARPLVEHGKQPFLDYGKKYLSDARNREFYKSLQFRVVEPGRVTPLKPSQMFSPNSKGPRQAAE